MIVNNYKSLELFLSASLFKHGANFRLNAFQKQAVLGVLAVIAMIAVCIFIELSKRKEIAELRAQVNKWNNDAVAAKAVAFELATAVTETQKQLCEQKIKCNKFQMGLIQLALSKDEKLHKKASKILKQIKEECKSP